MDVVSEFLTAGVTAAGLIAQPEVAAAWDDPSSLEGYSVGGLASHLARALATVDTYISNDPASGSPDVTSVSYYVELPDANDPTVADFHAQVRGRGETASRAGHQAVVDEVDAVTGRLSDADMEEARLVAVLQGRTIALGDYLKTRLVELMVHSFDLADSVSIEHPVFSDDAWALVAQDLAEITVLRHGPEYLAMILARPERFANRGGLT